MAILHLYITIFIRYLTMMKYAIVRKRTGDGLHTEGRRECFVE